MARRVNTKFVVILSAALVGAVGVYVGIKFYNYIQQQNPDVARARAEAAEKLSDQETENKAKSIEDLKTAVLYYVRAASLLSVKHRPGADELFKHGGDLSMRVSKEGQTQEDVVRYYGLAMDYYRRAAQENPLNKVVNELLLEADYQNSRYFPSTSYWQAVVDSATRMIENNQDGPKPRVYRAEVHLSILQATTKMDQMTPDKFADIDADVNKALEFDPHDGKAVSLHAGLIWFQARQSANRRGLTKTEEIKTDRPFQNDLATVRRELIRCLENVWGRQRATPGWDWFTRIPRNGVNADVAAQLVDVMVNEYLLSGRNDPSKLEAAITLLESAFASEPDKTYLADQLGNFYVTLGRPEKAEELFKQVIQRSPEKPEGYYRLAMYYRSTGDYVKAIASYEDVAKHESFASGRDAIRNSDFQLLAMEGIAWLNMELAERSGSTPEQIKAYLKQAADATDKLRAKNAPKGMIELLDGRMQLINHDIPHAVATLRLAEANLNGNQGLIERYRLTELQLARANELQNQLGAALELVNKALDISPGDANVLIQKGRLLALLGRSEEVRLLMMGRLLGNPIKDADGKETGTYQNEGNLPKSIADAAKRLLAAADAALNPNARVALRELGAILQVAQMELNAEDYTAAAADAALVLEKSASNSETENTRAYEIAISANVSLKRTDEAKKLAAQAAESFPKNATFQVYKAQLDLPEGALTLDAQKKIIASITDEYVRNMSLAALYHREKQWDEEFAVLQQARESLKKAGASDDREKTGAVLDQLFTAYVTAAGVATDAAKREELWKSAQTLVTDIEKLNIDGTDGKIYRGRLEFARTDGKSGIQYLQQAVAQRPDYAVAHLALGRAYFTLSIMNAAQGAAANTANASSALEEFRQVIRLSPDNITALQFAIKLLVDKGDSSSLKEAQGLLENGLALAPHNSVFIDYTEILLTNVEDAIKRREDLRSSQPGDRNNLRRLIGLYVRLKDKEQNPDKKQQAMDHAVALAESDFKAHPDDLSAGDLLAQKLVEYDKSDKGAARAIQIYNQFIANPDAAVRFTALVAKAEFFRNILLYPDAIKVLANAKLITHENLREEAADVLLEAIKIEPAGQDDAERHLADMYFDLGRMADAETIYLKVLEKNKNPDATDSVTRRLIESEMRLGKFNEAAPRLAELLKKQPQDIQGLLLRAYSNLQQGFGLPQEDQQKALQSALADLNKVLALDNGNADALFYRATAQIALGDRLDDAEKDLIQASKKPDKGMNASLLLAQLYVRTQRYEEASRQYREIITQFPDEVQVRSEYINLLLNLADLQRTLPADSDLEFVQSLRRLGPLDKFMDEVREASTKFLPNAHWLYLYAQGLAMQGKTSEAMTYFQKLYESNKSDAQVIDAYLGALLKAGDFNKVVELSSPLISENADFIAKNPEFVSFYLKRAAAYQGLHKPDEAVKDIDEGFAVGVTAATKSGNYGPFISVLNEASTNILDKELVAQRLRVRVAAAPLDNTSKIGLIQTLLLMNQPEEALKIVEAMTPSANDKIMQILILREAALVHNLTNQYAAAEKNYLDLEKIQPNNVENLNNYAYLLADGMNRPKEAITYAERALKLLSTRSDPGQLSINAANVYDTLGWAYYLANDNDKALSNLQKSIKVQPQAAAYLHLSMAYIKSNDLTSAQQKCLEGLKLAAARHDTETLAALNDLKLKLKLP